MKIYTKTGDAGTTGIWGGKRVDKDAQRINTYGTVDECNAAFGVARAYATDPELDRLLVGIPSMLFVVGSDLTAIEDSPHIPCVQPADVATLEQIIDQLESMLEPLPRYQGSRRLRPGSRVSRAVLAANSRQRCCTPSRMVAWIVPVRSRAR